MTDVSLSSIIAIGLGPDRLGALRTLLPQMGHQQLVCAPSLTALSLKLLSQVPSLVIIGDLASERDAVLMTGQIRSFPECSELPLVMIAGATRLTGPVIRSLPGGPVAILPQNTDPENLALQVVGLIDLSQLQHQVRARARALEQARDVLVATLTHDLRTPLSALTLCAERLSFELRLNSTVRPTLNHLNTSAARLSRAIDALSDYAEMDDVRIIGSFQSQRRAPEPVSDR